MSESKIITICAECYGKDIVKTLNSFSSDSYHCHDCKQEYFESVDYSSVYPELSKLVRGTDDS